MTSADIRAALKLTMDLAPAVARAAEIVESAERAERTLADLVLSKQGIEQDKAGLQQACAAGREELQAVHADLAKAKADAAVEKAKLNKALGAIQEKVATAQAALDATQREHAVFLEKAEAERKLRQSELDGVTRELDTIRARLSH